jgi:predicted DCC family thiol-disulfide oxidoreductase YuxK
LLLLCLTLGMALTLNVGLFIWTTAICLLGLLPSWFWERVDAWLGESGGQTLAVYYDGDCGLCKNAVRAIRGFFPSGHVSFVTAQSKAEIDADMRRQNSWVVVDESGRRYFRYEALLALAGSSRLFSSFVPLFSRSIVKKIGERIYRLIAEHRSLPCRVTIESTSKPPLFKLDVFTSAFVALLLAYVFLWNVAKIPGSALKFSERGRALGELLGLDQSWTMYAPSPTHDDGWFVIPGKLKDGRVVDVYHAGKPVTWERPSVISATFKNYRWQKFMQRIQTSETYRPYYLQYLCRDWNRSHSGGSELEELEIYFMLEPTLPNYEYATPIKLSLMKHRCNEPQAR